MKTGLLSIVLLLVSVCQAKIGIEYQNYTTDVRLKGHGLGYTIRDYRFDAVTVNLGDGPVYGILGGGRFEADDNDFESDDPVYGVGVKHKADNWYLKGSAISFRNKGNFSWGTHRTGGVLETQLYQLSAGVVLPVTDEIDIYGGPYINYIAGKWDIRPNLPNRIDSDLQAGISLGVTFDKLYFEARLTEDTQVYFVGYR